MKRVTYLLSMLFIVSQGAEEGIRSPISVDTLEGKSVYIPAVTPVNLLDEKKLQKEDQNSTGYRNAKE